MFQISGLGFQNVEAYPRADRSKLHASSLPAEVQKSAHEVQFSREKEREREREGQRERERETPGHELHSFLFKFALHALLEMYATASAVLLTQSYHSGETETYIG